MSSTSYTPGQAVDETTLAVGLLGASVFIGLGVLWRYHPEARNACIHAFSSPEAHKFFGEAATLIRRELAGSVHRALLAG